MYAIYIIFVYILYHIYILPAVLRKNWPVQARCRLMRNARSAPVAFCMVNEMVTLDTSPSCAVVHARIGWELSISMMGQPGSLGRQQTALAYSIVSSLPPFPTSIPKRFHSSLRYQLSSPNSSSTKRPESRIHHILRGLLANDDGKVILRWSDWRQLCRHTEGIGACICLLLLCEGMTYTHDLHLSVPQVVVVVVR